MCLDSGLGAQMLGLLRLAALDFHALEPDDSRVLEGPVEAAI